MKKQLTIAFGAMLLIGAQPLQQTPGMSFFVTSVGSGKGANLGGLAGADRHCQTLAEQAGVRGRTWHAYLSAMASGDQRAANARDRIGTGPWYNSKGVLIARNVAHLHSDSVNLTKQTTLTEKGDTVNGRGDSPNRHDILTGSNMDGTLATGTGDVTCGNWMSETATGSATVGHHDRQGGGANPTSWNSAHASRGCSQQNLEQTGGFGLFLCFAS